MHIATVGVLSAAVCTCTATSLSVFFYTTLPSQPTHEGKRTPRRSAATFAAGVSLENKFAPWKKEESSAAELLNPIPNSNPDPTSNPNPRPNPNPNPNPNSNPNPNPIASYGCIQPLT